MTAPAPSDPGSRGGMSDSAVSLRALAHQCRRLANGASMENVACSLNEIALDYDRQADRVDEAEALARARLAERGRKNAD